MPAPRREDGGGSPQVRARPAAGWHVDPTGRHETRYWDGERWTERVTDRGVESVDIGSATQYGPDEEIPAAEPDATQATTGPTSLSADPPVTAQSHPVDAPPPTHEADSSSLESGAAASPPSAVVEPVAAASPPSAVVEPVAAASPPSAVVEPVAAASPPRAVVEPVAVGVEAPAFDSDWYPDPTGRHEHRYFDGTSWTEHVADNARLTRDLIIGDASSDATAEVTGDTEPGPDVTAATVITARASIALRPDVAAKPNPLTGWIVVTGAVMLGAGSLGPWTEGSAPVVVDWSRYGASGDSPLLFAIALLLLASGLELIRGRYHRIAAFGAIGLASLAAIICVNDMVRISTGASGFLHGAANATTSAGLGLWACLVGAMLSIVGGIVADTHH
jgi:hypothetical protein